MRERNSASRRRFECANATVLVVPPITTILDGVIRGNKFICSVHPADGSPVKKYEVMAFFSWDACNLALELYKKEKEEEQ